MTTPPTWTADAGGYAYTLISGSVRCRVWRAPRDLWGAVVAHSGMSSAAYNFTTVDEAKAWCEKLMTEQKAGKHD